jgi:hypothetical protein
MVFLTDNMGLASIQALFLSIPETAGLLVFGLCLIGTAALIRRLLGRGEAEKTEQSVGKKV